MIDELKKALASQGKNELSELLEKIDPSCNPKSLKEIFKLIEKDTKPLNLVDIAIEAINLDKTTFQDFFEYTNAKYIQFHAFEMQKCVIRQTSHKSIAPLLSALPFFKNQHKKKQIITLAIGKCELKLSSNEDLKNAETTLKKEVALEAVKQEKLSIKQALAIFQNLSDRQEFAAMLINDDASLYGQTLDLLQDKEGEKQQCFIQAIKSNNYTSDYSNDQKITLNEYKKDNPEKYTAAKKLHPDLHEMDVIYYCYLSGQHSEEHED